MCDAGESVHPVVVQTSVNTTAAAASDDDEDDGSQCDVIATRPGHLLLTDIGSYCSASEFVFYAVFVSIVIIVIMV